MRNDTFYFMRKHPVDLLRYLPAFLAKDETFKQVQDTLSWEHESYRLKLVDIAKQFFVDTVSWGMSDWEEFLMIKPNPNASLEARRAAVRAKVFGGVLLNRRRMQELVEMFAPYGEVTVVPLEDCLMRIIIHNGTFYWDELVNALYQYIPAHIDLIFDIEIEPDPEVLHVGMVVNDASPTLHDVIFSETTIQKLSVLQILNDASTNIYDIDNPDIEVKSNLSVGFICQIAVQTTMEADYHADETLAQFEKYIQKRWAHFNHNPVIRHYNADNRYHNKYSFVDEEEEWSMTAQAIQNLFVLNLSLLAAMVDYTNKSVAELDNKKADKATVISAEAKDGRVIIRDGTGRVICTLSGSCVSFEPYKMASNDEVAEMIADLLRAMALDNIKTPASDDTYRDVNLAVTKAIEGMDSSTSTVATDEEFNEMLGNLLKNY